MRKATALMIVLAGLAAGREFTGKNGKKIEAEILSRTETQVELKLADGKTVTIPITSLSGADQLYVKTWEDPAARAERLKGIDTDEVMAAKGYFPLTLEAGTNQMFVVATVDGKQARFLLDFGANVPYFKQASLEKLGLTMKAVPPQGPAGGNQVIGTVRPKEFGNGDKSFTPPESYVLTLEHFPKNVLDTIDGVVGGQFFIDHGAVLDLAGKKLWMKP